MTFMWRHFNVFPQRQGEIGRIFNYLHKIYTDFEMIGVFSAATWHYYKNVYVCQATAWMETWCDDTTYVLYAMNNYEFFNIK